MIEEIIEYAFKDKELLRQALTHKSYAIECHTAVHNERLEFLGDSVLGLIVAHYLFINYPDEDEGHLSKIKSSLVSRTNLSKWAREINLGEYIYLGAGEKLTGGKKRNSILSNSIEAVIGAIYLDGGFDQARNFVMKWLSKHSWETIEKDHKSYLQEIVQKKCKIPPTYEIVRTEGPEHDKIFTVRVKIGKRVMGIGTGKNKKEAQQSAARNALEHMQNPVNPAG
jgi:ribonuclease-3